MCSNQCPYTSSVQGLSGQEVAPVYKECPSMYTCRAQIRNWLGHVYISKQFPSLDTPTFTAVIVPDPGVRDCNKASSDSSLLHYLCLVTSYLLHKMSHACLFVLQGT